MVVLQKVTRDVGFAEFQHERKVPREKISRMPASQSGFTPGFGTDFRGNSGNGTSGGFGQMSSFTFFTMQFALRP